MHVLAWSMNISIIWGHFEIGQTAITKPQYAENITVFEDA